MNINFNQMSFNNQNINQQRNDPVARMENQIMRIDKQIQGMKENEKLGAKEKQEKIKALKQSKEELNLQLQELKLEEKINETEEKAREAEVNKEENEPLTPLEEIEAEMGVENEAAKSLIKASNSVDNAQLKFQVGRRLEAESKTFKSAVEADIGRGQSASNDYRVDRMVVGNSKAESARISAFKELGEANDQVKQASEKVKEAAKDKEEVEMKKETEETSEINGAVSAEIKIKQSNDVENEEPKIANNNDSIGENVDALA